MFHMHFDSPDHAEEARRCEAASLAATFGITQQVLDEAYVGFEEYSVFLTISDDTGTVHAAARVILPGPAGFISLGELLTHGWNVDGYALARETGLDLTTSWEMSTFCRRPDTPGGNQRALAMIHGLSLAMRANGATVLLGILNENVRSYLEMFGLMFTTFPGTVPLPYYGSPASTPVFARHSEFLDTARRRNPEGYRLVAMGVGLDGITVPPLSEFVLRRSRRIVDLVAREAADPRSIVS